MKLLRYWAPLIIWMIIIFLLSSRQSVHVSDEFTINFLFFKSLHVIEYAILYVLWYRALFHSISKKTTNVFVAAFIFTVLYAVTDELHQLFVPTREGTVRDVIIDGLGALLAWILIKKLLPTLPKKLRKSVGM